jgi:hypothetical protein
LSEELLNAKKREREREREKKKERKKEKGVETNYVRLLLFRVYISMEILLIMEISYVVSLVYFDAVSTSTVVTILVSTFPGHHLPKKLYKLVLPMPLSLPLRGQSLFLDDLNNRHVEVHE